VRRLHATSTVSALLLSLTIGTAAAPQPPVNHDAQALADFKTRVDKYVEIRDKADNAVTPLKKNTDPREIREAQQALVERIGAARTGAKQGDIFTPEIVPIFRRLLRPEIHDRGTKEILKEDKPKDVTFKINGPYPEKQPLITVPPNILASLPKLPKDVDYRFVDKHLILHDARANTIVDYIPNAIP